MIHMFENTEPENSTVQIHNIGRPRSVWAQQSIEEVEVSVFG